MSNVIIATDTGSVTLDGTVMDVLNATTAILISVIDEISKNKGIPVAQVESDIIDSLTFTRLMKSGMNASEAFTVMGKTEAAEHAKRVECNGAENEG